MSVTVSKIEAHQHPQYMDHEAIYKIHAAEQGLTAFIGVHNTALGPALGGIRYKAYADENAALADVLRLSEAMTWKNAAGGLKHGGGKSVIMALDGERKPNKTVLNIFAEGLNQVNKSGALYFGAEDMNINEAALDTILETSEWIKGGSVKDPAIVAGTPSPHTALGVFECMKVAVKHKLGKDSLEGLRISMQGLGAVGGALAKHAYENGATLIACDVVDTPFEELRAHGIKIEQVPLDDIYDVPADIFAPNAIGGTLTDETIQRLKTAGVQIVCGAANNQQQDQIGNAQSKVMHQENILYCPDYIVNAGGVIWVAKVGENAQETRDGIREGVPRRFQDVLNLAKANPEKHLAEIAAEYSKQRVDAAQELRDKAAQTG